MTSWLGTGKTIFFFYSVAPQQRNSVPCSIQSQKISEGQCCTGHQTCTKHYSGKTINFFTVQRPIKEIQFPILYSHRIYLNSNVAQGIKHAKKQPQSEGLGTIPCPCGHSPNSHIHVSMCDLYIPTISLHILLQENRWTDRGNK